MSMELKRFVRSNSKEINFVPIKLKFSEIYWTEALKDENWLEFLEV